MTDLKSGFFLIFLFILFLVSFNACKDDDFIDFANQMGDTVRIPINAEITPIYNLAIGYEYFYADEYVDQLDKRTNNILLADEKIDTGNVFRLIYSGERAHYNVPFVPGLDQGFNLLDFTDLDFSQLEVYLENIENIWLKYSFENTLPFHIDVDVMMINAEGVIGELTDEPLNIDPATASDIDVYKTVVSRDSIKLNNTQIQNLIKTRSILYIAYMSPGWPELYERVILDNSNFLYLQMGVDVELNIVLSEFTLHD